MFDGALLCESREPSLATKVCMSQSSEILEPGLDLAPTGGLLEDRSLENNQTYRLVQTSPNPVLPLCHVHDAGWDMPHLPKANFCKALWQAGLRTHQHIAFMHRRVASTLVMEENLTDAGAWSKSWTSECCLLLFRGRRQQLSPALFLHPESEIDFKAKGRLPGPFCLPRGCVPGG